MKPDVGASPISKRGHWLACSACVCCGCGFGFRFGFGLGVIVDVVVGTAREEVVDEAPISRGVQ